ncbi:MAG TPA: hypothetical protein VF522_12950 [Ramlibacter sp.]|uniref:hypothetical protein n=1 Tax=Ramlibacter sp. TaxID=1917967 RepID=UPI002ED5300F
MTLSKTAAGHQVLKDRSSGLSPRQRTALILLDGKRSLDEVLAATAQGGVTLADIHRLVEMGLVAEEGGASGPAPLDSRLPAIDSAPAPLYSEPMPLTPPAATTASQAEYERYLRAYKVAIQLTAELGARGGRLHLAVEAAENLEELVALAPRIRAAVLPLKFARFEAALNGH